MVALPLLLVLALGLAACRGEPATLTVYSGRSEELVGPIIEQFRKTTGIDVQVRYGGTAELAATILEEGQNSPADVYWAQDAGALGALSKGGKLAKLPDSVLNKVEGRFRSPKGEWVGVTGRARVVAYNTKNVTEADLPDSISGFTDPQWKGRIGWAPTNGSFQAFVTALRIAEGDAKARQWLEGVKANGAKTYGNNSAIVRAVATGEVDVGFVNHYYLYTFLKEQGLSFPVRNYSPRAGDAGAMINVAGVGVLGTSKHRQEALRFLEYLLSNEAQKYFAGDTPDDAFEYPLVAGVPTHPDLPSLSQIKTPNIDLSNLDDLQGTLRLLRDVGVVS
ncbi:MAG: iron ABC transporter substrate-binding protein [Chloroflexi bacterium]|nr:iron ABC transporter substrate-binding protein [Chloroflexota bacterium]